MSPSSGSQPAARAPPPTPPPSTPAPSTLSPAEATAPSATAGTTTTPPTATPLPLASPFPFASAPDIIRAHQKDAYFAGTLANDLADLVLRVAGGRAAHAWAAETRTAAELAYWGLTAWLGHRTLGEEYCDLVAVVPAASRVQTGSQTGSQPGTLRIPPPSTRSAYVLAAALAPYLVGRTLPGVRKALRRRLEARIALLERQMAARKARAPHGHGHGQSAPTTTTPQLAVLRYLLAHVDVLTSGTHVRAVTLALFYFYGAYYTLTTRVLGLRYVFTRRRQAEAGGGSSADDVVGYEVLGALLVLQLAVQGYMHVRDTLGGASPSPGTALSAGPGPVQVSLDHDHSYTANNELLLSSSSPSAAAALALPALTRTPDTPRDPETGGPGYRFNLAPADTMRWLGTSRAARQCTLCLELLKDPAATPCGHVFCWRCIGDWVREKPECPLCRRAAQPQHILPLR